ncbi:gas vesicle protein GvpG [bacterium]|nr:gas vesicle protein GvpG [bacterium]MBU1599439.1 gas vesicle protein GvpG [bacterium]
MDKRVVMSPKKKNNLGKRKAIKKNLAKETPKRRLIPFTAGKLPSVSKSMPPAASVIPLVSKEIPLISKPIPLVSAVPNVTLPKFWENKAGRKKWDMSRMPITIHRKVTRPTDVGLLKALGETIVSPVMGPMKAVKGIASAFKARAEEERDPKVALELELLELKMRYEMGEISEEDYKIQETELKRRIKDFEKKPETRVQKPEKNK